MYYIAWVKYFASKARPLQSCDYLSGAPLWCKLLALAAIIRPGREH